MKCIHCSSRKDLTLLSVDPCSYICSECMHSGILFDPIIGDSIKALIPLNLNRNKNLYHISKKFDLESRISKIENYPVMFQKDGKVYYFFAQSVEHYAVKFDRIKVIEVTPLAYAERISNILENTKNEKTTEKD